jgi:hypothetical protein
MLRPAVLREPHAQTHEGGERARCSGRTREWLNQGHRSLVQVPINRRTLSLLDGSLAMVLCATCSAPLRPCIFASNSIHDLEHRQRFWSLWKGCRSSGTVWVMRSSRNRNPPFRRSSGALCHRATVTFGTWLLWLISDSEQRQEARAGSGLLP